MPQEFVARNGVIALNNSVITGSLNVTAGITGSLFGTSSFATTASSDALDICTPTFKPAKTFVEVVKNKIKK